MRTEDKEFIQALISDILGLPRNSVIWAFPNAPRPPKPYAVLQLYSFKREAQEDVVYKGEEDFDVKVPVAGALRIQFLGDEAVDRLEYLVRKLEAPTIADRCHAQGIAFFDAGNVTDIESLLSKQTYEPRASVDVSVRYTSVIADDIHTIARVKVESNINDVKRIIDIKE